MKTQRWNVVFRLHIFVLHTATNYRVVDVLWWFVGRDFEIFLPPFRRRRGNSSGSVYKLVWVAEKVKY